MSRSLAALSRAHAAPVAQLDAAVIREVLVVRMNGRMGNTLFLTPLLGAIHAVMPHAEIDVLVNYPDAADLLRGLPGIRNVLTIPHKGWWHVARPLAVLRRIRGHRYDLAIDPAPNSFGARLVLSIVHARWRLGFGDDDQWLRIDFPAKRPTDISHDALRPLALLQQAFGHAVRPAECRLQVANSPDELAAGARLLAERIALGTRVRSVGTPVIGFFASARDKKDLGPDWWRAFWQAYLALSPQTVPVEVLPFADHPPIADDFATVYCRSPRALAATVAHVDWFFSADTGPMHLASASGAPTIAFFERTSAAKYGPIKAGDTALSIVGLSPQDVAAACARIVAAGRRGH